MRYAILALLFFNVFWVNAQNRRYYNLYMRNTGQITLWDGLKTTTYGFAQKLAQSDLLPGPVLTANEGDSVIVDVRNISQGPPHTIHWHGLDVNQANDGTPATSFEIHHMELRTYRFKATHAGTFIYHCHMGDVVHVQMGMYGVVIVHPADSSKRAWTGGPMYNRSVSWLTSELDKKWHDTIPNTEHPDTVNGHESFNIPIYKPTYFLVNGKSNHQLKTDTNSRISGKEGDNVYVRISNIGYLQNKVVFPAALKAKVIDSDGRPLPAAFYADTLWVSPGERFGVMLENVPAMNDSVEIKYVNMNTHLPVASQWVTLTIEKNNEIHEVGVDEFSIFPNPVSSTFTFQTTLDLQLAEITIVNLFGQIVFAQKNTATNTIDIANLGSGLYMLQVKSKGYCLTTKIVRQ